MQNNLIFFFLICISAGLNTVAQTLLKMGAGKNPLNIYLLGGLMSYGLSTIFYILILGKLNLSVAYPVVIGLTVISTTIAGVIVLREQVSPVSWMGVGLMLSGLLAIAIGKTLSSR